jgi:hypothetical protein
MTFKLWEMLKNASEVTLVPKIFFFLKILKFVQSFVECKVSQADGAIFSSLADAAFCLKGNKMKKSTVITIQHTHDHEETINLCNS